MIVGYTMLHYGLDYMAQSLLSLRDYVDKYVIVYSDTPTFGYIPPIRCPDETSDLFEMARNVLGHKLIWLHGQPQNTATVLEECPNASLIIEADADEVYPPALIGHILRNRRNLTARTYRLPMVHFWRSFNYVCRDGSWPCRLHVPGNADSEMMYQDAPEPVYHFGYARKLADMEYKVATSVHRTEWRPEWWSDTFLRWTPTSGSFRDLHPVNIDFWNAEKYDKSRLPAFMKDHPYFNAEVIE